MRPTKLTMTAFGTYLNKTVVDFNRLGERGLYLVCGDTGSGKTTIFDGITYAIYGKASGVLRTPMDLRCRMASIEIPTEVELEFINGSKHYTINRKIKCSKRDNKPTFTVDLYREGEHLNLKNRECDEEIERIIGLSKKQFTEVVMIAQNDFLSILKNEGNDRSNMLQDIFGTFIYEQLQIKVKADVNTLAARIKENNNSINQYISGIKCLPEQKVAVNVYKLQQHELPNSEADEIFDELLAEDKSDIDRINAVLEEVKKQKQENDIKLGEAGKLEEDKKVLAEYQLQLVTLREANKTANEEMTRVQEREPQMEFNKKQIIKIENDLPRYDELEAKREQLAKLQKQSRDNNEKLSELENKNRILTETVNKEIQEFEALKNSEVELQKNINEEGKLKTRFEALESLIADISRYQKKYRELAGKRNSYTKLIEQWNKLQKEASDKFCKFNAARAGILACDLREGEPCPVCGSKEHPHKAVLTSEDVNQDEVNSANEAANEAKSLVDKQSAAIETESNIIEEQRLGIISEGNRILNCSFEQIDEVNAVAEAEMIDLKKIMEINRNELAKLKEAVEHRNQLEVLINRHKREVAEIEPECKRLRDDMIKFKTEIDAVGANIKEYEEKFEYKSRNEALKRMTELNSETEAIAALIQEKRTFKEKLEQDIKLKVGLIDKISKSISESPNSDIETLRQISDNLEQKMTELNNQVSDIKIRYDNNLCIHKNIQSQLDKLRTIEEELSWKMIISDTINGSLPGMKNVTLENYIQTFYFDRIVQRASLHLLRLSNGQYEFNRHKIDAHTDGRKKDTIFHLDVKDHFEGTERSVTSLSGGESFLASLSLALGLSEEIQAFSGGVKLETMFVDEGFGTLDEDKLRSAIRELNSLSDDNRLIGIISHVGEFKSEIDKQLRVSKDKFKGSRVEIIT